MRYTPLTPAAFAMAVALACVGTIAVPSAVFAQDAGHHDDRPSSPQANDQRHDDHHDDHADARHDDHAVDHPDARPDDAIVRYRHDHPGATAHCHDGFFTRTTDRGRACSKHGGIDVWIAL